jgi:RNA polymerase sigma factor (sigma-70 family)
MKSVTKKIRRLLNHNYSDKEIMDGLNSMDAEIMQHMYRKNLTIVSNMARKYGVGGAPEVHDILIDALMRTVDNIKSGKFQAIGSIMGYFLTICRNICIENLRHDHHLVSATRLGGTFENIKNEDDRIDNIFSWEISESDYHISLIVRQIRKMDVICIKLFDMRFGLHLHQDTCTETEKKQGYREIAQALDMTETNARKKFERCWTKLLSTLGNSMKSFNNN